MDTYILGHRGAMGEYPENTEISFIKALAAGADGIEFDVHLTGDGVPIVIHDERVDRITDGSGLVSTMSLEEIKQLDIVTGQSSSNREKILTLKETLDLISTKSKLINIELKQGPVIYPGLEDMVVEVIKAFNIVEKVIISSFNHYSIKLIKSKYPDIRCGLLYMAGLYQPWVYAGQLGAEAIHPFFVSIDDEVVKGCKEKGIMVNVFGVNDRDSIIKLLKMRVDSIITDYPGLAEKLRQEEG